MTWKTTYETWGNFEDLETNLKEELVSLAENEKMLEDRENHRRVCLDNLRRNRAFCDELLALGISEWKANITV